MTSEFCITVLFQIDSDKLKFSVTNIPSPSWAKWVFSAGS